MGWYYLFAVTEHVHYIAYAISACAACLVALSAAFSGDAISEAIKRATYADMTLHHTREANRLAFRKAATRTALFCLVLGIASPTLQQMISARYDLEEIGAEKLPPRPVKVSK